MSQAFKKTKRVHTLLAAHAGCNVYNTPQNEDV